MFEVVWGVNEISYNSQMDEPIFICVSGRDLDDVLMAALKPGNESVVISFCKLFCAKLHGSVNSMFECSIIEVVE